ncbi:MAG TPA: MBL fold metallo-hydrolase, partial [Ktedonobacterales bacterium]|nr:MBL fold metallo-hydrolase [Ktedonobacterales bacterium]
LAAIQTSGHDVADLRTIILTHIHLDHAGATGALIQRAPRARVLVHPLGAAHLADPTRLLASATQIYGDRMDRLWGAIVPVPADRITTVADGAAVTFGRRALTALHTPGHAVHHIAYHDAARGALFAGDVAGVRLQGEEFVRPPTPPPDLDLEAWSASIARLRALRLDRLYLPHFGVARSVDAHLSALEARLYAWGEIMLTGMRQGKDAPALATDLAAASELALPEQAAARNAGGVNASQGYEGVFSFLMSAQGYQRYFRKRHPERLTP